MLAFDDIGGGGNNKDELTEERLEVERLNPESQ